jgi:precorrin-2/cobalt-factor-2 C20-methyltransferase
MYIHKEFRKLQYDTEIIPGITSFCAAAARVGVSLAENRECIAVVPSAYECENLDSILEQFDNIVLMKVARNLPALTEKLVRKGLADRTVLVSRCGFEDERIEHDLNRAANEKLSYFTTMLVKKAGVGEK